MFHVWKSAANHVKTSKIIHPYRVAHKKDMCDKYFYLVCFEIIILGSEVKRA